MLKLLSAIFTLLSNIMSLFKDNKLREDGRREAIQEAQDEAERQVELAENVVIAVDFEHDRHMRARFDAAAGGR